MPDSWDLFITELGLISFRREYAVDYHGIMAACVITLLPVLLVFLIVRRRIIERGAFIEIKT